MQQSAGAFADGRLIAALDGYRQRPGTARLRCPPLSHGGTRDSARNPAPASAIARRDGAEPRVTTAGRRPTEQRATDAGEAPRLLLPSESGGLDLRSRCLSGPIVSAPRFALVLSPRSARRRSSEPLSSRWDSAIGRIQCLGVCRCGGRSRMARRPEPDPPTRSLRWCCALSAGDDGARGRARRLPRRRPGGSRPPWRGRSRTGRRRGVPGTRGTRLEYPQRGTP